jgi:hypothetical protein
MYLTFLQREEAWQIALLLFMSMILFVYIGARIGKIRAKKSSLKESASSVNYLSGLLFFLLAFTFGMGGNRFDERRSVVVQEANAIGTALLRADLYPIQERELFRKDFKSYLEARITFYELKTDWKAVLRADSTAQAMSAQIWKRATILSTDPQHAIASRLMIPALNDMIDITTTRLYGELAKVPESIVWMLLILACINAFYIGYASVMKGNTDWLVEVGFCLLVSVVVLFTLDVDRPRRGFVNLDTPNKAILELRKNFR